MQDINKIVGANLRSRRQGLGMSSKALAAKLRISCQQLSKYETGKDRLSADKIFMLSRILSADFHYFFHDPKEAYDLSGGGEEAAEKEAERLSSREIHSLTHAWPKIKNSRLRIELLNFIKSLAHV